MTSNFIQKIENDVQERLYDLLIIHLLNIHTKVRKNTGDMRELIELLDNAIVHLQKGINPYNRLQSFRHILILCNTILSYDTSRNDLKKLKIKIIDDFTHSEHPEFGKIPMNYQINEVRITYDVGYLHYLIGHFIKLKEWDKALYSLIAVKLIEPDDARIDEYYKIIKGNVSNSHAVEEALTNPNNEVLALDACVVISKIWYTVQDYKIKTEETFDLEKLGNTNKFIITPSVRTEVKEHIQYQLSKLKKDCKDYPRFNYTQLEAVILKRMNKMLEKYGAEPVTVKEALLEDIKGFYKQYLLDLEDILIEKLRGKYVSQKLRKLAQRENMLPEEGDMILLAEIITLNKAGKNVSILTKDKDLTKFSKTIREKFGVKVYA